MRSLYTLGLAFATLSCSDNHDSPSAPPSESVSRPSQQTFRDLLLRAEQHPDPEWQKELHGPFFADIILHEQYVPSDLVLLVKNVGYANRRLQKATFSIDNIPYSLKLVNGACSSYVQTETPFIPTTLSPGTHTARLSVTAAIEPYATTQTRHVFIVDPPMKGK